MIVGSLLLILVAIALLVLGLASGSSVLLISSIAASLLAAMALVVGARQAAAARSAGGAAIRATGTAIRFPGAGGTGSGGRRPTDRSPGRGRWDGEAEPVASATRMAIPRTGPAIPQQLSLPSGGADRVPPDASSGPDGAAAEDEPADEPAVQLVPPVDAARVARLTEDVLVVDGRPRYHLATCPHLTGRASEPVPVNEARELGFTPCAVCEPDTALLTP